MDDESAPSEHDLAPIADALFRGNKIEAIKLYRESHGGGLKEEKDAVEELEVRLRETSPDRFAADASRAGCLGCVGFLLSTVTIGCAAMAAVYLR